MPIKKIANIFNDWERELNLLIAASPSSEEFWQYWSEREEAIEKLIKPGEERLAADEFERLLGIADAYGYVRLRPRVGEKLTESYIGHCEAVKDPIKEYQIRAELYRLGTALTAWIMAYDARGKTYREFRRDYEEAAYEFDKLLATSDLTGDLRDDVMMASDLIAHFGYEPSMHSPPHSLDDLIRPVDPSTKIVGGET